MKNLPMKHMLHKLSDEQVKHVAKLANVPLTKDEENRIARDLSKTLDYIEKIDNLDTSGVKPTSHISGSKNIFREDKIIQPLSQEEALSNSTSTYKDYFMVEAVLEE